MFTGLNAIYRKQILVIFALNIVMGTALAFAIQSSSLNDSNRHEQALHKLGQHRSLCAYARPDQLPTRSRLELKERAAQVFRAEKQNRKMDGTYLTALSMALGFKQYDRVEALLRRYECGTTL